MERLWRDRSGAISTVFMLLVPALVALSGLAVEYGNALMIQTRNQRVADSAAYAAAIAYHGAGNSLSAARAAATRIANLNNLSSATVLAEQVTSPANASRSAIQVTVTQFAPLLLSSAIYGPRRVAVPVVATAELVAQAAVPPSCITAIDGGGTGVTVSGGANITANNCGVASNANLTVANCGAYVQSNGITYAANVVMPTNCGGGQPPLRKADGTTQTAVRAPVADPYAGNAAVAAAAGRLSQATGMAAPVLPAITIPGNGNDVDFKGGYNASDVTDVDNQARNNGCRAYWTSNAWDYICPSGSNTVMRIRSICGGCTLRLNPGVTNATVLTINSSITAQAKLTFGNGTFNIGGNYTGGYGGTEFNGIALNVSGFVNVGTSGAATFSSGTYNIGQGLYLNGSATTVFGSGTFNIGRGTIACGGSGFYSICALSSGTTTIAGPSVFNLPGGVRTGGGATLNLGSGNNNSYRFGASSDGYAFRGDGGADTIMADASSGGNVYEFGGHVNLTGGGSCLIVGAAPNHDIKGNLWGTGAMKLGAGVYTITGSVNFGGSGGGDSSCGGSTIGLYADNVTFVIGAAAGSTATSGDCAGQSFCLSAGYSNVVINAPTSGALGGFAVIGPQSASITAGGTFTSGASNTVVTGVFYMPNGSLNFSGGASLGDASGCLELVGRQITVSAGALLGSSCISSQGSGTPAGFSARLVG
ncbi:pilus assembly protein TadG-related protein [Sandarakinorhabdus sp. DWP1-3-1]|uniref:pilus assembly protein TadG-related protein n=1 Tax=Sandarakinorhabdus sp. DWP1-3-1 TaxID=2804627 RepID=UPI003CE98918